jgi:hypothetical protein
MILMLSLLDQEGHPDSRRVRPEDCPFVIGRDASADWRIVDPAALISRCHCVIDADANGFIVTDVSANGLFIDDEPRPLGRGVARALAAGTRLRLGDHEILVDVIEGASPGIDDFFRSPSIPRAKTAPSDAPPLPDPFPEDDFESLLKKSFGGARPSRSTPPEPAPFDDSFTLDFPKGAPPAADPKPGRFLSGRVFFRVPPRMWKELPELVELRLSPRQVLSSAELREIAASFRPGGGAIDEAAVARLGRRMNAQILIDAGYFRVEALSSPDQDLDLADLLPLRWDWRISPLRTGRTTVRLRLSVRQDALGISHEVDTAPFERDVEIRIRSMNAELSRFWRDHWKWIVTTGGGLGTAATVYGWAAGLFRG